MENDQIEEPSCPMIGQEEQEKPPMKPRGSYEVKGPFQHDSDRWQYDLWEDGRIISASYGDTQQEALERALLMAAAPRMADAIEITMVEASHKIANTHLLAEAWSEAQGNLCEACETPGQPSRMVFSPTNRLYHPTCLPEDVKKAIAEEAAAADKDDLPW